jgi:hypothetical protein
MTSGTITFDRLAYIDRLKSGGIEERQARAHAEALDTALRDTIATKADVDELGRALRAEILALDRKIDSVEMKLSVKIHDVETRLEAKIETAAASVKVDVLRWLVVTQAALGGFIFAVLKFMH